MELISSVTELFCIHIIENKICRTIITTNFVFNADQSIVMQIIRKNAWRTGHIYDSSGV